MRDATTLLKGSGVYFILPEDYVFTIDREVVLVH
jgi:hypothetical protein